MASEGQQVLFFTCHEHIAHLFQRKKVEPLWLPGHKVAFDTMKPESEEHGHQNGVTKDLTGIGFVSDSDELLEDSFETSADSDQASAI